MFCFVLFFLFGTLWSAIVKLFQMLFPNLFSLVLSFFSFFVSGLNWSVVCEVVLWTCGRETIKKEDKASVEGQKRKRKWEFLGKLVLFTYLAFQKKRSGKCGERKSLVCCWLWAAVYACFYSENIMLEKVVIASPYSFYF